MGLKREPISALSGVLFGVAWWIMLDGVVTGGSDDIKLEWYYTLPGIFATVALVMINLVSLENLSPTSVLFTDEVSAQIRIWLLASFTLAFGCITGGIIVFALGSIGHGWMAQAIAIQPVLIFVAAMMLMYARSPKEDESFIIA